MTYGTARETRQPRLTSLLTVCLLASVVGGCSGEPDGRPDAERAARTDGLAVLRVRQLELTRQIAQVEEEAAPFVRRRDLALVRASQIGGAVEFERWRSAKERAAQTLDVRAHAPTPLTRKDREVARIEAMLVNASQTERGFLDSALSFARGKGDILGGWSVENMDRNARITQLSGLLRNARERRISLAVSVLEPLLKEALALREAERRGDSEPRPPHERVEGSGPPDPSAGARAKAAEADKAAQRVLSKAKPLWVQLRATEDQIARLGERP